MKGLGLVQRVFMRGALMTQSEDVCRLRWEMRRLPRFIIHKRHVAVTDETGAR